MIFTVHHQETLEELKARVTAPDYEFEEDDDKEGLLSDIAICEDVKNTLTFKELLMLAYLRNSKIGTTNTFYMAAKANYEALNGISALFPKRDDE